jgi:hypothetical protein
MFLNEPLQECNLSQSGEKKEEGKVWSFLSFFFFFLKKKRLFWLKDTKARGNDCDYALDLACDCMSFFTRQFEVNYPYPKLDNVSTPLHPLLGMENWGLITYDFERNLLCA